MKKNHKQYPAATLHTLFSISDESKPEATVTFRPSCLRRHLQRPVQAVDRLGKNSPQAAPAPTATEVRSSAAAGRWQRQGCSTLRRAPRWAAAFPFPKPCAWPAAKAAPLPQCRRHLTLALEAGPGKRVTRPASSPAAAGVTVPPLASEARHRWWPETGTSGHHSQGPRPKWARCGTCTAAAWWWWPLYRRLLMAERPPAAHSRVWGPS